MFLIIVSVSLDKFSSLGVESKPSLGRVVDDFSNVKSGKQEMLEVVDSGSWWGLIDPFCEEELLLMSGSYNFVSRLSSLIVFASFMMEALDPMLANWGSCDTQLDIFEKLDDTKGVAKVFTGIIQARNDRGDDIKEDSKTKVLLFFFISSSNYCSHDRGNQYPKT